MKKNIGPSGHQTRGRLGNARGRLDNAGPSAQHMRGRQGNAHGRHGNTNLANRRRVVAMATFACAHYQWLR